MCSSDLTMLPSVEAVAAEVHQLADFTVRRDVIVSWRDGSQPAVEFEFVYVPVRYFGAETPVWAAARRLRDAGVWLEVYENETLVVRDLDL